MAKLVYEDDMLRHNPGGGLEEAAMRKVVERSREMLKVQNKVELSEISISAWPRKSKRN